MAVQLGGEVDILAMVLGITPSFEPGAIRLEE